jgi:hypothetical protein
MSANPTGADRALPTPAGAFTSILTAAVGFAAGKLERKVAAMTDKLQGVADPSAASGALGALADEGLDELAEGGAANKAGAEGLKAGLHGKNPVWAAVGGAWQSGTPVVRAAIVTAAASTVLLLILTPVLGVVFLLSLLLIAAVQRARRATA